MGAGSSKDGKGKDTARDAKPVANVNNRSTASRTLEQTQKQPAQKSTFITQPDDSVEDRNNSWNDSNKGQDVRGRDSNRETFSNRQEKQTTQGVWRPDQDSQNELNEVLQIPTDNNRYNNNPRPVNTVNPVRQEDLPETYAQRKQREQYTLNQQMLIRQKTIYRNPEHWRDEEEEEDSGGHGGFDPNKFRSVNYGQTTTKSTIFSTKGDQESSVHYGGQRDDMDDFDVRPRQHNQNQDLPRYNASEQDLMASLERELM